MENTNHGTETLTYDKAYFVNFNKMNKIMGKGSLLIILGFSMGSILLSNIELWVRGVFALGSLFLVAITYYDVKYMLGLKKHPFMLYPHKKILRVYNEFKGNKEIDITQIKEIKIYTKAKEPILWEVSFHNRKEKEDINVSGFDLETLEDMMLDLKKINPNFNVLLPHESKKKG